MTRRVLTMSTIALVLLIAGWVAAAGGPRPEPLRSRHSEPATAQPPSLVAVTSEGKLYHRPDCAYIHGPVQMESAEQATAEGYTPCTRCLSERR